MHFDLLIRGGMLVTGQGSFVADIGVTGERIAQIGDLNGATAEMELSARGLHVLPGLIDSHVHFREPGFEHKEDLESGTRAAVFGGVTTVCEMPNTSPPTTSQGALEDKLHCAEGRAWCDYGFYIGATPENTQELDKLELLPGAAGVKLFMGSSTGSLLIEDDPGIREVLRHGVRRVAVHAEDEFLLRKQQLQLGLEPLEDITLREKLQVWMHPRLRPAKAAQEAVKRLSCLCQETGRAVHILHVTSRDELPLITKAKQQTLPISCEVTPQHLWFAAPECYQKWGTLVQQNPPIRSKEHQNALRKALQEGVFDTIGSDHAPHTLEEKSKPYPESPSGIPGVQTLLPVMLSLVNQGLLSLEQLAGLTSENPARLLGVPNKGFLREGFFADLCLVDLNAKKILQKNMLQSKCGWSPFEGEELTGWPVHVCLRGQFVLRDGALAGKPRGKPAIFKTNLR